MSGQLIGLVALTRLWRWLRTPLRVEYSARTKGWTWRRLSTTWAGREDVCYAWGRMPLRIGAVWLAAAGVFGMIVWACCAS